MHLIRSIRNIQSIFVIERAIFRRDYKLHVVAIPRFRSVYLAGR